MSNGSTECNGICTWKFDEAEQRFKLDIDGCEAGSGCVCQDPNELPIEAASNGTEVETPCIPDPFA